MTTRCALLLIVPALSVGDGWILAQDLENLRQLNRPGEVDRSIDRGLRFLLSQRNSDGSLGRQYRTALTSLSVLAFLSCGHVPGETEEGKAAARALDYLLSDGVQRADGFFGALDHSDMYGHGITTLLLAEVLGQGRDPEQEKKILTACRKAIDLILRAQAAETPRDRRGGWRYKPEQKDSDLSVTAWQVMALRAAKNSKMDVPTVAIERAIAFIKRCFETGDGSFLYQPGEPSGVAMTAAGLLSLQVCGVYEGREVTRSSDRLLRRPVEWRDPWFYYGVYYYAQAMRQMGGVHDRTALERTRKILLERQADDGSWPSPPQSGYEKKAGPIYRTAMSILALSVEYGYLPIYQR